MSKKESEIVASLMANKDFRDWVLAPMENRNLYWEKWIEAYPEYKEAIYEARNSILKFKFKESHLEEEELAEILNNIISKKPSGRQRKISPVKNVLSWRLKIAATFLVIFSCAYLFRYLIKDTLNEAPAKETVEIKTYFNPKGQKSRIKLPDGTFVKLNAESTLSFPVEFGDSLRVVELHGEAFFDVVRNEKKPFIVKTKNLQTEVLGTTFNVRAFDEEKDVDVALVTGKVKVSDCDVSKVREDHILLPGEKLTFDKAKSSYEKSHFDITEETGWKDEILVFKNTKFQSFIKLLERWYGVKIKVLHAPDKSWSVNGHFENESLEEVLIGVQFTYDIDYKIENDVVTLNCK